MSKLQCIVVTPEATVFDAPADFVVLPLYDGEIGIAPHHAPLIGRLGYGELRVRADGQVRRFYVDGGFVQVIGNTVSVMTLRAVAAENLSAVVLAEQLKTILAKPAAGDEMIAAREKAEAQTRAQLRIAQHA